MNGKKVELKVACIEREMTQNELGKMLGLTSQYISEVIIGASNLSRTKQIQASVVLGKPREILFR